MAWFSEIEEHFMKQGRNKEFLWNIKYSLCLKKAVNVLCRQIFQIVPRKYLMRIDELFWLSALFHLMIALWIAYWSTRVFCWTSETC